jgi:hypothetical protein
MKSAGSERSLYTTTTTTTTTHGVYNPDSMLVGTKHCQVMTAVALPFGIAI